MPNPIHLGDFRECFARALLLSVWAEMHVETVSAQSFLSPNRNIARVGKVSQLSQIELRQNRDSEPPVEMIVQCEDRP